MTFQELGLAEPLLRAVDGAGYAAPTSIQSQAIPHVLAARDLLGCAQTGTGKTAAFALPILQRLMAAGDAPRRGRRPIRALILSPTRELAAQIGESFRDYGRHTSLRQTVIFGGVGQHAQTSALQRGVDILIATPGRLLDLANQGFVHLQGVEVFVLDEADRMLDMGFIPDVRRILTKLPARRQTLLFSATMPESIMQLAGSMLADPVQVRIAPTKTTTELIEQSVYHVARPQKIQLLVQYLSTRAIARAIVFTRTKHGADRVARQLKRQGIAAVALHGDKSQTARQRALADFKANRTDILVATDIAARGIDVDGISHVVNFDLPREAETYIHRIGRTGRAGASGVAVSLCDNEEKPHLRAIERLMRRAIPAAEELAAETPKAATPRAQAAGKTTVNAAGKIAGRAPGKVAGKTAGQASGKMARKRKRAGRRRVQVG